MAYLWGGSRGTREHGAAAAGVVPLPADGPLPGYESRERPGLAQRLFGLSDAKRSDRYRPPHW